MKNYFLAFIIAFSAFNLACTPEEEIITFSGNARLAFSADTVLFDTVFTTFGSISKRIKVYNKNENSVNIADLHLGRGANSPYRIFVNGIQADEFSDKVLLGGDSLLIIVQVTVDAGDQNLPFLVKDSIVFNTNNNLQDVKLVAYGQDAIFLNGATLPCNTTWTAEKPYLIYNSVLVDSLCSLSIEKGTRVYFNSGSSLFIKGSIQVEGTAEEPVIFRNDRLDETYENAPGQWNGLVFLEGSKDNGINFAQIHNADIGIRLGTPDADTIPDLVLGNTIIENMATAGILCFTSDLYAYNTLVDNCGTYTVGNFAGGNYTYGHCTFANYNFVFFRQEPSVVFTNNLVLADNSTLAADLHVNIFNSIVWGSLQEEILTSNADEAGFVINANNNLLRTNNEDFAFNNILNTSDVSFPEFKNPEDYNYRLDTLSPAKDTGHLTTILKDLDGNPRDNLPDLGAYERLE